MRYWVIFFVFFPIGFILGHFIWTPTQTIDIRATDTNGHDLSGLYVANAVDPLIQKVVEAACHGKAGHLIFRAEKANFKRDMSGCTSGTNMRYFARCYEWKRTLTTSSMKAVEDVDLGAYTCVGADEWPYRDRELEAMKIGRTYVKKVE